MHGDYQRGKLALTVTDTASELHFRLCPVVRSARWVGRKILLV